MRKIKWKLDLQRFRDVITPIMEELMERKTESLVGMGFMQGSIGTIINVMVNRFIAYLWYTVTKTNLKTILVTNQASALYKLQSKLRVSPLINPEIIPYITPL